MPVYSTPQTQPGGKTYSVGDARQTIALTASVAMTTAMIDNVNDEVGLFFVPKGFVVTAVRAAATDMDSNGTPTLAFDIGDAADEDRLMAATTVGRDGSFSTAMARTGLLFKYNARTEIRAYVQAAAATAVAGTLHVVVEGFIDEEYSTTPLVGTIVA